MSTQPLSKLSSVVKEEHHASIQHATSSENDTVPLFPSPMNGFNEEVGCFSPRHEASTIELFFDLWFVANLASFTAYHTITNSYTFWSYVAFFIVLWTSWFHIVCFDARFSSDSIWERGCKSVHFCSFAAFVLVGYKFAPVAADVQTETPHWIYRVLCFALLLSRAWLAIQYAVTAIMCSKPQHRVHRLTLPLALNALLFICVAAVCGGLFAGFSNLQDNLTGILVGLYIVLIIEFFGSLAISMFWRKLSFQATHIGERLGLLCLIIIGEGVLGLTKTITRTMGKNGPTWGASGQVYCIIMILVFIWILYFDKVPRYRFGTVKQQFWMALHLPFHLGILGVVEGAQQLVQAHYIYHSIEILGTKTYDACVKEHLDGEALTKSLFKAIKYFKINDSARGTLALDYVYEQIYILGNDTDVCSPSNSTDLHNDLHGIPTDFSMFLNRGIGAMVQALDIDIPAEGEFHGFNIALQSWVVVYTYFWSAIIMLLLCFTVTRLLADGGESRWQKSWRYKFWPVWSRAVMITIAVTMLVIGTTHHLFIQRYIASGWILPTVVLKLWSICMTDRFSRRWAKKRAGKQTYESVENGEGLRGGEEEHEMGRLRSRGTNGYGYPH